MLTLIELEDYLAKNINDLESWKVYADCLQSQGQLQGEILTLNALRLETEDEEERNIFQQEIIRLSQIWQAQVANNLNQEVVFSDTLANGSQGIKMTVIPPGIFVMGSSANEKGRQINEAQHLVKLPRPFAIGIYTIDYNFYRQFSQKREYTEFPKHYPYPIQDTWQQAKTFASWLSQQTKATYRLPTEAEWEYAARAGTMTAFWWGDFIQEDMANFNIKPMKYIDSYPPNPWGLYNVHGNTGEWVEDIFIADINSYDLQVNPLYTPASSRLQTQMFMRVVKGGDCTPPKRCYRSAHRNAAEPSVHMRGIRLVREL